MKWHHYFELIEKGQSHRLYQSEDIFARLDTFEHVLRVAIYKKGARLFPTYSICPDNNMPRHGRDRLSTEGFRKVPQGENIKIDDMDIEVEQGNFRLRYLKQGQILFEDREIMAYNFDGELGQGSYHYLSRDDEEHIFGLGDKTGDIDKARRHFRMETFDAMGFDANGSDPLYKQVPFYICKTPRGAYGVFYDTYANGELHFGDEINNYYPHYKYAHFEEDSLVYYVIFGSEKEILHRYMELLGKAALPPKWTFEYCGSTMAYTDAPDAEKQLRGFADKVKELGIHCGGFYLSSGYTQIGDKRYVFHWNKDKIPDPKALAEDFAKQGIHFLPNVKPAFLTSHPFYDILAEKGYFLHYENGKPAIFPFWGGEASYLDFTNDGAFEFWSQCVKEHLVDLGYDSIWNDNNEYDIHDASVLAHGWGEAIPAKLIRPLFPLLMSMASREAIASSSRVMAVSRSGVAGMERLVQTWTGDNRTSFEDFRGNHKMAMTMALSGYRFFGQDIGGFAGPRPNKELFLRWIQYGLFTPRFTLHSWNDDGSSNMPWLYEDLIDIVKKLFAFRHRLVPYLYSEANAAVKYARPLIKPVFLDYPDYDIESDCFLCGESILSCPTFDEGMNGKDVLLPEGDWYLKEKLVKGLVHLSCPLDEVPPYLIKAGSVLPLEEDGLLMEIYARENGIFEYEFYDDDSLDNSFHKITVNCKENEVIVKGVGKNAKVRLIDNWGRKLVLG